MLLVPIATLAGLLSFAVAAPSDIRHVLHERRDSSGGWSKVDTLDRRTLLPMRIGLTQNNLHRGHDLLMEVSDPTSRKYGQHYTPEQIHELFAPSDEAVAAVISWLHSHGIDMKKVSQSHNKQWIQFDSEAAEAEALLKTKFHIYEHASTGQLSIGCDEYHVHDEAQKHIDYITPGIKFLATTSGDKGSNKKRMFRSPGGGWRGPIQMPLSIPLANLKQLQTSDNLAHCGDIITPSCILAMYNVTAPTRSVPGNNLGIYETEAQYLDSEDMNNFYNYMAPQIPQGTFPTVKGIDGAKNKNDVQFAGGEACLDFQVSYPLIYPQQTVFFAVDDNYYQEHGTGSAIFNNFLDAIDGSYCNYSAYGETGNSAADPKYPDPHKGGYKGQLQCGVYKPTNIISLSYAIAELSNGLPRSYLQRQCNEYMKLGMQGVSVLFSSGDYGTSCLEYPKPSTGSTIFNVFFPGSCPYVTAVGSTVLPPGKSAAIDQERATTKFASGGGFSNIFLRPSYQTKAVQTYFKSPAGPTFPYYNSTDVGDGLYNRTGRGVPDVAAVGQSIAVYCNGIPQLASGTSASAPIFASILNRINGERLSAGKPTIGFVNPVLYQNPGAFHDITVGNNSACSLPGFKAGPGWDPVTGLGTPNYPALLDVFMSI